MKDKILTIILWIALLGGLLFLNYPVWANLYNQLHKSQLIRAYQEQSDKVDQQILDEIYQQAEQYNAQLASNKGQIIKDAFDDEDITDAEYINLLNPDNNGIMGILEIPQIGVYLPIDHGTSTYVITNRVGHMQGTSLPVGGESSHCILASHRGLPSAELFTQLDILQTGDRFFIHILGRTLAYEVEQRKIVLPSEFSDIEIEQGKDYVTLITCTPYGINSHRELVRGVRIPYEIEDSRTIKDKVNQNIWEWMLRQKLFWISHIIFILFIIINIIFAIVRKKKLKSSDVTLDKE